MLWKAGGGWTICSPRQPRRSDGSAGCRFGAAGNLISAILIPYPRVTNPEPRTTTLLTGIILYPAFQ